jgi:hypothetical protein
MDEHHDVRTTLTNDGDDDVAERQERERRKRRVSFKTIVNDVLRTGLAIFGHPERKREGVRTRGFNLGPSLVGGLDNVEEVLSSSEGEDHR